MSEMLLEVLALDLEVVRTIRKIALIGIFSNDLLTERLVFKGGSALELIYKLTSRASIDIDFSIEDDFTEIELQEIKAALESAIQSRLGEEGYFLFDFLFTKRPEEIRPGTPPFWGGYNVEFKVVDIKLAETLAYDIDKLRRRSLIATPSQGRKFLIEISKHEYCIETTYEDLEGYKISVYTLRAIMFEKLRAICQQMKEYPHMSTPSPRPRDFYDIQKIMEFEKISQNLSAADVEIIKAIFAKKEVPVELLGRVEEYKDFHRQALESLIATLIPEERERFDFDECFAGVVELSKNILKIERESAPGRDAK